jgi:mono/diheme cytochrome c family protein
MVVLSRRAFAGGSMKAIGTLGATSVMVAAVGLVLVAAGGQSRTATRGPAPGASAASLAPQQALVTKYCVTCHSERNKANAGGLALDALHFDDLATSAEPLERVVRKLRAGLMPPPSAPRPDPKTYKSLASAIQARLDHEASVRPNPGRKDTFHRLNRTEYRNVVRDVLDIEIDVNNLLPVDNPSFGFDNIAGTLTLNESLMEQYLSAAGTIVTAVLGSDQAPAFKEYRASYEFSQDDRLDGFPMGTRGGMRSTHLFSRDGDYTFDLKMMCGSIVTGESGCAGVFPDTHEMELAIDGERIALIRLPKKGSPEGEMKESYQVRVAVEAGPHDVAVWFLKQPSVDEFDGVRKKFAKPMHRSNAVSADWMAVYQPSVQSVTVGGPYDPGGPGDTPARRRLLLCTPADASAQAPCARRILSAVARRAYRRSVSPTELSGLMGFFARGRAHGFEGGIDLALRRILTSPAFLFRVEVDPSGVKPDTNYQVSDVELASRLSFFLWRSVPDDELLNLAVAGRLHVAAVLDQQARRMLADPRAAAMTEDFAGQWLQLRKVDVAKPNAQMFPNFDDSLKGYLRRETELFVDSIRRDDRSVVELLTANYSYLNQRLATHYGITGVKGGHFRRVVFAADNPRRGLLGHGSILTVTSSPIRTRPVVRGKFILENILGTPPPAPPANVPPFEESGAVLAKTMRERMAAHRANPVCAGCHATIDPLGFALENFNPVGQFRTVDENFAAIDASGVMPNGAKFDGPAAFRGALVQAPENFVTALTERLMIYGLGRGLEYYDMPAVRAVVRGAESGDYRFSDVVLGIVRSVPFRLRRSPALAIGASTASASNVSRPQ